MYRLSFLSLIALAIPAAAADADTAAKLAPLIDNQTVAVARFRVRQLTPASVDRMGSLLGWDAAKRKAVAEKFDGWKEKLARAEIADVFLVVSLTDLNAPAAVAIPKGNLADPKDVGKIVAELHADLLQGLELDAKDDVFLAGSKAMLGHLKAIKPDARPELAPALAAGDGELQIVVIPSKDHRLVIEQIMPTLPKELGGGSTKAIASGMQWAALSANLGEKPSLQLTVQARDGESAKVLSDLFAKSVDIAGRQTLGDDRIFADLFGPDFAAVQKALAPTVQDNRMVVRADESAVTGGLGKVLDLANEAAVRHEKMESLKQIAIAMHKYMDMYSRFPARAGYGATDLDALKKAGVKSPDPTTKPNKDAKPILSWRVYLLPFLDQEALYREFKLDEPWDSEHNKKLIEKMPKVFQCDNATLAKAGKTRILAPVGPGLAFEPDGPGIRIADIADGTSNTILLLEAAEESAVVWTKPDDLMVDEKDPKKGIFGDKSTMMLVALADGSTTALPKKIDAKMLWAMFTRAGNEVIVLP